MRSLDKERAEALAAALQTFSRQTPMPGIASTAARDSLVRQMIDSLHRVEFVRRLGDRPIDARRMDPADALFDPVRAAFLHDRAGDKDEAAWLVFLSTHFGFHRRWKWELTRKVYGALGQGPNWTWARTSGDLPGFRTWFENNASALEGI